jgi:uncharacterized protein YjbI with pentapeptide repeats
MAITCAAFALSLTTASAVMAACSDPAGPLVEWIGCLKKGANLNGANLTDANLTGATLIETELTEADLTNATLSDGRICGEDSIGTCK